MLTEEIFHNPNVRKFFRNLLLGSPSRPSRADYSVKPTERGLKKIDDTHPYYVYSPVNLSNNSTSNTLPTNALAPSLSTPIASSKSPAQRLTASSQWTSTSPISKNG